MIKSNLAVLMAERKLSIQDISDKTGLSRTTISALVNENGKGIQFDTMNALCELFEVHPGQLFSYESFLLKLEYVSHTECGPYLFSFSNLDLEDVEKRINDSFTLKIRLSMHCNFEKFEDIVQVPFAFEINKNGEVTDVYIAALHRKIYSFFSRHISPTSNRLNIWKDIELFFITLIDKEFGLKTSFDLMFHH